MILIYLGNWKEIVFLKDFVFYFKGLIVCWMSFFDVDRKEISDIIEFLYYV